MNCRAQQLDIFETPEQLAYIELCELTDTVDRMRKGLFRRHTELAQENAELKRRLDTLEYTMVMMEAKIEGLYVRGIA